MIENKREIKSSGRKSELGARLLCAAKFVRGGSVFIDVGTDHAYLPIYLLSCGKCGVSYASDVNDGPLERATAHVSDFSLEEKIKIIKSDGLRAFESMDFTCDKVDVAVLGMGGELIERIILESSLAKKPGTRLILQPMTHPEIVRESLISHGFSIVGESVCREGKLYQIICAEYTGKNDTVYSRAELLVGKAEMTDDINIYRETVIHQLDVVSRRLFGKKQAEKQKNGECEADVLILNELENLLKTLEKR